MAVLELAKSSRSSCQICKEKIEKGALRFGAEGDREFHSKPSYKWHHWDCALEKCDPRRIMNALDQWDGEIPDTDESLEKLSNRIKWEDAKAPAFDIAPTNRAKCVVCRKPIEKDSIRGVVMSSGDHSLEKRLVHPNCLSSVFRTEWIYLENPFISLRNLRNNSYAPERQEELVEVLDKIIPPLEKHFESVKDKDPHHRV